MLSIWLKQAYSGTIAQMEPLFQIEFKKDVDLIRDMANTEKTSEVTSKCREEITHYLQ